MNRYSFLRLGAASLALTGTAYAVYDACDAYGPLQGSPQITLADTQNTGINGADYFGRSMVRLDYNGDGTPDIAVGASGEDTNGPRAGVAYVFLGPIDTDADLNPALADATLYGRSFNENAGWSIASPGDIDGNGSDDLVIGTLPGTGAAYRQGLAYYVAGGALGPIDLATQADATFFGENTGDEFGSMVSSAGDFDGDGYNDILIGAPKLDDGTVDGGAAYVFAGPFSAGGTYTAIDALAKFTTDLDNASFGVAGASLGDINGDGRDDIIIGSPREDTRGMVAGAAYIFHGFVPVGGGLNTLIRGEAQVQLLGNRGGDRLGSSFSLAGDVNRDGSQDLWIGAKQQANSKRGAVYGVTLSGTMPASMVPHADGFASVFGEDANDLAGSAVIGNVDFNNDGVEDVLIGGERADGSASMSGAAWVVHGPIEGIVNLSNADFKAGGQRYRDFAGSALVSGDFNDDGFDDAVVGAYFNTSGGVRPGRVGVFYGGRDVVDEVTWYQDGDNDGYGGATTTVSCSQPVGYSRFGGDCDDSDFLYNPGASEGCSDPDYNCDGQTGSSDNDGDGFTACTECDDSNFAVNPAAAETCGDGIDNDCDGIVDNATVDEGATGYYLDFDGDAFGGSAGAQVTCYPGIGITGAPYGQYINVGGDCNDFDFAINPGSAEYCDGFDNNCDGLTDDPSAVDGDFYYADNDADGYGSLSSVLQGCEVPIGYVANADDCDDVDVNVNPLQIETCDFIDNDCDGQHYLGGLVDASTAQVAIEGSSQAEGLGGSVAVLNDVDGDGKPEMAFGAPAYSEVRQEAGAVYLYNGGPATLGEHSPGDILPSGENDYAVKFTGHLWNGRFGTAVVSGDFDNDGYEDIVITAPKARVPRAQAGAAYLFYGPLTEKDYVAKQADAVFQGGIRQLLFGTSAGVGDFNGDGFDDLAVGAVRHSSGGISRRGGAYIFYGGSRYGGVVAAADSDAIVEGDIVNAEAGTSIANGIDLDNDGLDELVMGAEPRTNGNLSIGIGAGAVFIKYGDTTDWSGNVAPDAALVGAEFLNRLGRSVESAGDTNGDGIDDLLIGTTDAKAYLLYGNTARMSALDLNVDAEAGYIFSGPTFSEVGQDVAGLGDVNDDGFDDFILSASGLEVEGTEAGAAIIVYGAEDYDDVVNNGEIYAEQVESFGRIEGGVTFPTYSASNYEVAEGAILHGDQDGQYYGRFVAGGADFNDDGVPDVVIGAPRTEVDGVVEAGGGFVFFAGSYGVDLDAEISTQTTYIWDSDADSFGDESLASFTTCAMHAPISFADPSDPRLRGITDNTLATDCEDSDATIYPGAPEIDGDGIDRDCDGYDDENNPPFGTVDVDRIGDWDPDFMHYLLASDNRIDTNHDLEATVVTTDLDGDPVSVSYQWYIDGAEVAGEVTETLSRVNTARGQEVSVVVTLDDGRDTVVLPEVSVDIDNAPPFLDACEVTPSVATVATDMVATPIGKGDYDPDHYNPPGLDLAVNYRWQKGSPTSSGGLAWLPVTGGGATTDTLEACINRGQACVAGAVFRVRCRAYDGIEESISIFSDVVTIANAAPEVSVCEVTPNEAYTDTPLTALVESSDPDNHATTVTYQWIVNGVPVPGEVNEALSSTASYSHFDTVQVACQADDGFGLQSPVVTSAAVTILNRVPTTPGVVITPAFPNSSEDLVVTIDTPSSDIDGDGLVYEYEWYRQGVLHSSGSTTDVSTSLTTLGKFATTRNETWEIQVRTYDGSGYSDVASASVSIENTAPTITGTVLTPAVPTTQTNIVMNGVDWYDEDGDTPNYLVDWYVNGVLQPAQFPSTILPSSFFVRGDDIYAVVTARDPFDLGSVLTTDTVTVGNAVPDSPEVAIVPSPPGEFDDLTCDLVGASVDPDGDALTYVYTWYSNNPVNPGPILISGGSSAVLPESYTEFADTWWCTAQVTDSLGASPPVETSASVAIQDLNAPPAPTLDPMDPYRNEEVVNVSGTCISGANDCDTVSITCDDGLTVVNDVAPCDASDTFSVDISLNRGSETTCSAICRDITLNESLASNETSTEVCDPYDIYEDDGNYGDDSGNAITDEVTETSSQALSLPDNNTSVFNLVGNIIGGDEYDWYEIDTSNAAASNTSSIVNPYNFEIELTVGREDYDITVFRDNPSGAAECVGTAPYDDYSFFVEDRGDAPHHPPATVANACGFNSGLYNDCQDMSATYWVRVERSYSDDCQAYELRVTNGVSGGSLGADNDGDGFIASLDCDDTDPSITPGRNGSCPSGVSCLDILGGPLDSGSGRYVIDPDGPGGIAETNVYCDMSTDGGGWTLVSSSSTPVDDAADSDSSKLLSLSPLGSMNGVWDGMRDVVSESSDIRFACKQSFFARGMDVDLSFYNVDWYQTITSGSDGDSCFAQGDGANWPNDPARRNNLSGVTLPFGNAYAAGFMEGEDGCGSTDDFTVDFDDRGMNSNQSDGTDWGEDDGVSKCGVSASGAAFYIFVR